jgi:hypothetical protein
MYPVTHSGVFYYPLPFLPGSSVLLTLDGDPAAFDGSTATFGYLGNDNVFTPFLQPDGSPLAITARGGFEVRVPRTGQVGISLSGEPGVGLVLDAIQARNLTSRLLR